MLKKLFTMFLLSAFFFLLHAEGQRYLLHINQQGKQEAIPLMKGEKAIDAIQRVEKAKASYISPESPNGLIDTIRNYTGSLNTNFGWTHQDVAFQWFEPQAGGLVKEFWWYNYNARGDINKGTVRGWKVDTRLQTLPGSSSKFLGYYLDPSDGDGGVTPYKPTTGDQWFYKNGAADSSTFGFDPLGTEALWLPGGIQVTLDSAVWQGLKMDDWGDPFEFNYGEPFGFTLSNDSPAGGADARMEILSAASAAAPYHSFKWYEVGRTGPTNKGWWWRTDYEWGMYAVVEYTTDRAPKMTNFSQLFTTLKTTSREVKVTVTDDNPGGGAAGVASVYLFYKISPATTYDSVAMTATGDVYAGNIAGAAAGSSISYYSVATDVAGNRTKTSTFSYTIFAQKNKTLFMWNARSRPSGLGPATLGKYYMKKDSTSETVYYDTWDVANYGSADVPQLYPLYDVIIEVAAEGGRADLTAAAETFLASGTATNQKVYLLSDQDHGFISGYADTTFDDTNVHAKYFGVKTLGPQDYPYTGSNVTWPWGLQLAKTDDPVFGFIKTAMDKDTTTIWYDPNYELGFVNWMDEVVPTAGATTLFKDGSKVVGVRNSASDGAWHTFYLAFDYLSVNFRSDTSLTQDNDPKYKWIVSAGGVMKEVSKLVSVKPVDNMIPGQFSLDQNYPNPFNPATTINYSIPMNANVSLKVFNLLGQEVATLVNQNLNAGNYSVNFDASKFASGVYFYKLEAGSFTSIKKMMLVK